MQMKEWTNERTKEQQPNSEHTLECEYKHFYKQLSLFQTRTKPKRVLPQQKTMMEKRVSDKESGRTDQQANKRVSGESKRGQILTEQRKQNR